MPSSPGPPSTVVRAGIRDSEPVKLSEPVPSSTVSGRGDWLRLLFVLTSSLSGPAWTCPREVITKSPPAPVRIRLSPVGSRTSSAPPPAPTTSSPARGRKDVGTRRPDDPVGTRGAHQDVGGDDRVGALAGDPAGAQVGVDGAPDGLGVRHHVGARRCPPAVEPVVAGTADQPVSGGEVVVGEPAVAPTVVPVVAGAAVELVAAPPGADQVVPAATVDPVETAEADDHVVARCAVDPVAPVVAGDRRRLPVAGRLPGLPRRVGRRRRVRPGRDEQGTHEGRSRDGERSTSGHGDLPVDIGHTHPKIRRARVTDRLPGRC